MTVDEQPTAPVPAPHNPDAARFGGTTESRAEEREDVEGIVGTPFSRWLRFGVLVGAFVALGVWRGLPIVIVIVSILVMIFLHELGHYLAARWSGMKATEFFIGFGPKIWSFQRGETEFGVKALPAGAYVRIIGMNNLEEVDPADEPRAYRQQPFRARLGVAVAGSAMHFALAILLLAVQFAFIGRADGDRWEIGAVTAGSAAAAAGLREGDRLTSLDGQPVGDYSEFRSELADAEPGPATLTVERDGTTSDVTVDLSQRVKVVGTIGEDLDLLDGGDGVHVGALTSTGQAAASGLDEGASVVSINGHAVTDLDDVAPALDDSVGGVIRIATGEAGAESEHRVDLGSEVDVTDPTAFLGVGSQSVLETSSVPVAVGQSFAEFGRLFGQTVVGIGTVLNPVNLADFATTAFTGPQDATTSPTPAESTPNADATRPMSIFGAVLFGEDLTAASVSNLVGFMIVLNLFLGVFNLIPLLPFDGGHVAIAVYEKLQERRKKQRRYVSDVSKMLPVAYMVVFVLAGLFVLSLWTDITRGVPT